MKSCKPHRSNKKNEAPGRCNPRAWPEVTQPVGIWYLPKTQIGNSDPAWVKSLLVYFIWGLGNEPSYHHGTKHLKTKCFVHSAHDGWFLAVWRR